MQIKNIPGRRLINLAFLLQTLVISEYAKSQTSEKEIQSDKVIVDKNGIYIPPGTKVSQEDQAKIQNILSEYNTSLYKITVVNKGNVIKTIGTSKNLKLDNKKNYDLSKFSDSYSDCIIFCGDATTNKITIGREAGKMEKGLIDKIQQIIVKYQSEYTKSLTSEKEIQSDKVIVDKNGIYIPPGTKVSQEDQAKIQNILSEYNTSLYKITVVNKGNVIKTIGTSKNLKLDNKKNYDLSKFSDSYSDCIIFCGDVTTNKITIGKEAGKMEKGLINKIQQIIVRYQ